MKCFATLMKCKIKMTFKMSELIIANAKKNGDLPKEQDYKFITLFDALKNTDVIKNTTSNLKKSLVALAYSLRRSKNRGHSKIVFFLNSLTADKSPYLLGAFFLVIVPWSYYPNLSTIILLTFYLVVL